MNSFQNSGVGNMMNGSGGLVIGLIGLLILVGVVVLIFTVRGK